MATAASTGIRVCVCVCVCAPHFERITGLRRVVVLSKIRKSAKDGLSVVVRAVFAVNPVENPPPRK